jgi:Spy/CpxP family protein refolding chaperone
MDEEGLVPAGSENFINNSGLESAEKGGKLMPNRLHRILTLTAAAAMLLPMGLRAQQSDQQQPDKNQSTTQSGDSTPSQPDHPHRGRGMRGMARKQSMSALAQKLNLTDDQKQQFHKIHQEMMKEARTIHSDSSLTADQKRDKLQQLRKQSHQQMFSILTPEQKDQLKQLREQHQKEMKEKNKATSSGDQASAKPASSAADDDDPFAGMTSDDDDGPGGN